MLKFTKSGFLCLILFFACNLIAQGISTNYYIKPIPLSDRTDLIISVSTTSTQPLKINPLIDNYGTKNIDQYITEFIALKGRLTSSKDTIFPDQNKEINLQYRVSFDPAELSNNTFGPNISKDNFHVFACQWMICLGNTSDTQSFSIKISVLPPGWDAYNSFNGEGLAMNIKAKYDDIFSRVIGAAKDSKTTFTIAGKPLNVYTFGSYRLPKKTINNAVKTIIESQRSFFNDYDFPFYNVIILPKEENVAGINVAENSFVCFLKNDISMDQLTWIIAHEVFHTWLGNKIDVELEEDAVIYRDHWFTEGFTDYFANKIRLEAGIINKGQFAQNINQYIANIADNPYANYTLSELENMASNGNYGIEVIKLQYYRGALIALEANRKLGEIATEANLKTIMNKLLQEAKRHKSGIPRARLFEVFQEFGIDLQNDFENYIVKGESINLSPDALGSDFNLKPCPYYRFDLGFNLFSTKKLKIIQGVEKNSAAYKAMLRDGMKYLGIKNQTRFGAGWEKDQPVVIRVEINDEEIQLEYHPKGEMVELFQFVKK